MYTGSTRTRMDDQRTTLIQKDPRKGTIPNNCLLIMWKILTAQIREEIYFPLRSRGLFFEEQKGYRKVSRGTGELFHINWHILNECKKARKNLVMAWIDNQKDGPTKLDY